MPLNEETQNKSLKRLQSSFGNNLSSKAINCLTALNTMAAKNDIYLSAQSEHIYKLIDTNLKNKNFSDLSSEEVASRIYLLIVEQMHKETSENKNKHRKQGHFGIKPIHERGEHEQLNDSDMVTLMPTSHGNIEVLAPLNIADKGAIQAIEEGIINALGNNKKSHIITLAGPDHWRGIYLSKPTENNKNYRLELFDSFGPESANQIKGFIQKLLEHCGIKTEQIDIISKGPVHRQKDSYSCGDYALAHSIQKMCELGVDQTTCEPELIRVMEKHGNKHGALREITRKISERKQENTVFIHQGKPVEKTVTRIKNLTKQEKKIYTTTISEQEKPSLNYKKVVAELIKSRQSIFAQTILAIEKEETNEQLTDEEVACKLQAEEFRKAGFKP